MTNVLSKSYAEIIDLAVSSSGMHKDPYNILVETNRLMQLAIADRRDLNKMLESLEIEFPTAELAELLTEQINVCFERIDTVRKNNQMAQQSPELTNVIPK